MEQKVSSCKRKKLKLFDLLPDELVYIILAYRLSVDYNTFSHRSLSPLLAHRAEVNTFSLVCRRWRHIIPPVRYETVIITSKSEANGLAFKLRQGHQPIGHYIKKLRIEGGQGRAIYTILARVPRLTTLCISLGDISSKQNAGSLCRGLKLINPKHLVLRDNKILGNQGIRNVVDVLIECMTSIWSNLVSYDHPYDEDYWVCYNNRYQYHERYKRIKAISRALTRVPNLQTVYVPRAYYADENIVLNAIKNPSLERICSRISWNSNFMVQFEAAMKAHPRLRNLVHLPLPGPWSYPVYVAVGDRTISEIRKKFTFHTINKDDNVVPSPLGVLPDRWW